MNGVRRAEFRDFDGRSGPLRDELEFGTPEILDTDSQAMPVTVETTMGQLILDFESVFFALDTGQSIDYGTIERVCTEYWAEWKARSERKTST